MQQPENLGSFRGSTRRGARRAKSGCRTCKIRKIKCDEGRPACQRCISTQRVCDGYGIWGGGGSSSFGHDQRRPAPGASVTEVVIVHPHPPISVLAPSSEEKYYFDWFKTRTLSKLSSSFVSRFWDTLTIQASFQEPAVLNAVLALSSVHKRGVAFHDDADSADVQDVLREQEQFALQHYVKAMRHLQPHLSGGNKASLRIALITCAIFIALEFFRGHFEAAVSHLQNGLNVLNNARANAEAQYRDIRLIAELEPADAWVVEAFSRLQFQVELFKQSYQGPCLILHAGGPGLLPDKLQSINEAWKELQCLLNKIFELANEARQHLLEFGSPQRPSTLVERQQQIQRELERWLYMFELLRTSQQGRMSHEEAKGYKLLPAYHVMADIMTTACLCPGDESVFDSYTTQFVFLVSQMAEMMVTSGADSSTWANPGHRPGHRVDMNRSYVEIGWAPLLYYIAIKCRVHRVRLQAIRLLECSSHREGIWDSEITACITRKVMRLEERDFYQDAGTTDNFPLTSVPSPRDLSLPVLPDPYRIRGLDVVLSGNPVEKISLFGEQRNDEVTGRVLLSEFNVQSQRWMDRSDK